MVLFVSRVVVEAQCISWTSQHQGLIGYENKKYLLRVSHTCTTYVAKDDWSTRFKGQTLCMIQHSPEGITCAQYV